jgi:hypothetical protein
MNCFSIGGKEGQHQSETEDWNQRGTKIGTGVVLD